MKISVIIPLYNAQAYLPALTERLKTIEAEDTEFIFVDDGSTDETPRLCEDAKKELSSLTVIRQENGGAAAARNAGLSAARGKLIGFADGDDFPKPEMYATLAKAFCDTDCDMVMGGYEKVTADKKATPVALPYDGVVPGGTKEVAWSMAFWSGTVDKQPIHTLYGSVWPNLYRKAIIEKYGIRFPQGIVLGEDLLFNLDYLSHCRSVYMIDRPLYGYFTGNESATRKQVPDLWKRYTVLLEQTARRLTTVYGESDELKLNVARQTLNDAIGVIEEQILPFTPKKEQKQKIRDLCADEKLRFAAKRVARYGTVRKERIQARLFLCRAAGALRVWLK